MDRDGAVRGEMLALAIRSLLQVAEGEGAGPALIQAEIVNHHAFDVPPAVFARFYEVVATVIAELLGPDWTREVARAWAALLAEVRRLVEAQATASGLVLQAS